MDKSQITTHIHFTDLKEIRPFEESAIALFIDDNGDSKILKNRYGNMGLVSEN